MKVNLELLRRLRTRFLRMRHIEHFDMQVVAKKNECGTAMCIAGHVLDLQGYKWHFDSDGDLDDVRSPSGRKVNDELSAAAKEIGLPYKRWAANSVDAYDLFHDFSLKTPKQAADRIQELIESSGEYR
jgi:hypothetical protein